MVAILVTLKILFSAKDCRATERNSFFFLPSLIVAQFIVFLVYFIATGSASVMMIVAFIYPTVLLYLINPNVVCGSNALKYILIFFIVFPLVLSCIGVSYSYIIESPEQNIKYTIFDASSEWIVDNFYGKREYTDAHTGGNHMIMQFQHEKSLEIISIGYSIQCYCKSTVS